MTLVAAAVCPQPPLLVPQVAAGAAAEMAAVLDACERALASVLAAAPEVLVVVGGGPRSGRYAPGARGSFAGFGVPLEVRLAGPARTPGSPAPDAASRDAGSPDTGSPDAGSPDEVFPEDVRLPLSLTIGAWLLHRSGWSGRTVAWSVTDTTPAPDAAALGSRLAALAPRVGLLAMGDGSARRSEKAPGYLDPAAESFDLAVSAALAAADPEALLAVDPREARRLLAVGRASWQVLAGAAGTTGTRWRGEVLADDAPYGVAYLVARWLPDGA